MQQFEQLQQLKEEHFHPNQNDFIEALFCSLSGDDSAITSCLCNKFEAIRTRWKKERPATFASTRRIEKNSDFVFGLREVGHVRKSVETVLTSKTFYGVCHHIQLHKKEQR